MKRPTSPNDEALAKATALFDVTPDQLSHLGGFENYVYRFVSAGKPRILRVTHDSHRSLAQVEAEIDWLNFLSRNGAPVAAAVPGKGGALVGTMGEYHVASFEEAPGVPISRENRDRLWNDRLFTNWGQAVGTLHRLTRAYEPPPGASRRPFWRDERLPQAAELLPASEGSVVEAAARLEAQIDRLPRHVENFGLVHGDAHPGNFFIEKGDITLFDFDDSSYHYFASDIAVALYYALWLLPPEQDIEEFARGFLNCFLTGYRAQNDTLTGADFASLPLFLRLRDVTLYLALNEKKGALGDGDREHALMDQLRSRITRGVACVDLSSFSP